MVVRQEALRQRKNWRFTTTLAAGGLVLALSSCGASNKANSESSDRVVDKSKVTSSSSGGSDLPTLVFDDLGGGSSVIEVYPGVTSSVADKQYNGTFNSGDRVMAECKTEGRT